MVRRRDESITADDLAEYVATRDDFNLELYVYRTARELGLSATHGGTYEDPITNKPRQYDVRASGRIGNQFRIALAIECKSLRPSYPLLVSRIPRSEKESFHEVIVARQPGRSRYGLIDAFSSSIAFPYRGLESIYTPGEQVGKSTAQVGRNERGELTSGDSEVFDKWSQALSSAADLINQARDAHDEFGVEIFFSCVLPVLVIADETLWVADYSEMGALVQGPIQVAQTTVFVDRKYSDKLATTCTLSHLHIYTRSQVRDLLTAVAGPGPMWQEIFRDIETRTFSDDEE